MSNRFVNKTKTFKVTIEESEFELKALHWGDRNKMSAIMRRLYSLEISDDKKEKAEHTFTDDEIKLVDSLFTKYIVSIKDVDIPIKDIQFKEIDVIRIMTQLLVISNLDSVEVKNSEGSLSSK